jgi:hypothetical protein
LNENLGGWPSELDGPKIVWEFDGSFSGPWLARAPVLFWLIEILRPRQVAIVGNAARPAFLAACQAVGRLDLPTRVLGAFVNPLKDETEALEPSQDWRRVGAQHCLSTEAAQSQLARDPADLLVLDASAATLGGARAPELWSAALTGARITIVEARTAHDPSWNTILADAACLRVGGLSGVLLIIPAESEGPAVIALRSLLLEPEKAYQLQRCLEELGAGLVAAQAARETQATAERLEISLAETAARGDAAAAEVVRLEDELRTAEARGDAATTEVVRLEGELWAAASNSVAARQKEAHLEGDLRIAVANAVAAQQRAALLEGDLQTAVTALAHAGQVNQTLSKQLVVVEDRAAVAQAWRTTMLASSSWRLSQRMRFLLGDKPGGLKRLLRRSPKLLLWTGTLQLPRRWRVWQSANAEVAPPLALASPKEAVAGPDARTETPITTRPDTALASALQRLEILENRTLTLESLMEMERGRIDWALGGVEGVTAQIDAYHAYRETQDYRAPYASAAPLVSICVATVDRANLLLERSIASIRAQSYHNLQIIVVGDNCSDDTALRLAALGDNRIHFVNLPERGPYPRQGIDRWYVAGSNAMNHALSLCEGHFVTHLDDDDAMVPHRIETLVGEALQNRADFLWHPFWCENRDGTWLKLGNGRLELGQVSTGSIFYHRYFARVPWDVHAYRLREPGDWNRLRKIKLMRPRMRFVEEPLLYHHVEQAQAAFIAQDGERFLE